MDLENIIRQIRPLDAAAEESARRRQNVLIKPLGSLGRLEELSVQLAGISGDWTRRYRSKAIVVMCADNGVYAEGVSAAPKEITLMQSLNFQKGITGVGVLSKLSGSDLVVVDIGIDSEVKSACFLDKKIRRGTSNLAKEPAMSRDETLKAVEIGFEEVRKLHDAGYDVVGTGEMGLGNTTTSSLVLMALTGCGVEEATGKGAGLTEEAYSHKKDIIRYAFELHGPDKGDPLGVLEKVGGFDIAGLVGVYLGAACYRLPVVIDGVISVAAALVASLLCPDTKCFMIPSHCSAEPAYGIAMKQLGLQPYFNLGMRLGEGSGCPLTFLLIDAAQNIINDMSTFEEAAMDDGDFVDIRESQPEA